MTIDFSYLAAVESAAVRAVTAENASKDAAASVIAAYLGKWSLPVRCQWFVRDDPGLHILTDRTTTLAVDGREVWRGRWLPTERAYAYEWTEEWLVEPWKLPRSKP